MCVSPIFLVMEKMGIQGRLQQISERSNLKVKMTSCLTNNVKFIPELIVPRGYLKLFLAIEATLQSDIAILRCRNRQ